MIAVAALCAGCASTGAVPESIGLAGEYRDIEREIRNNQTDLAVTGERIGAGSRDIAEGLAALENSIAAVLPDLERDTLLPQVRSLRGVAEAHQAEAEKLNVLLARERENSDLLSRKFNDYDQVSMAMLSKKDREITALKEKNKKLAGQRNTLLAIIITALGAIVLFVVVKRLK